MRFLPQMLLVGSTGRNVDKTELATAVIQRFCPKHRLVGLKVTAVMPRNAEGHLEPLYAV